MVDADDSSSKGTPLLLLGMLVDRTSFDETDDYGIDRNAIVDSIPVSKLNTTSSSVLKNGRVRRRLRWRPKRRNEGLSTEIIDEDCHAPPHDKGGLIRSSSSNGSVNSHSNMSHCSRVSNRSTHSFSSTATMQRDNTKDSDHKAQRFPLPRPNYPKTFDGVATIGNEATMIHARINGGNTSSSSPDTVFAAADLDSIDTASLQQSGDGSTTDIRRVNSTPKKRGFPPLFRRTSPRPPMVPRQVATEEWKSGRQTPPLTRSRIPPKEILSEPLPQHSPIQSQNLTMPQCLPSTPTTSNTGLPPDSTQVDLKPRQDESAILADTSDKASNEDLPVVEMDSLDTGRRVDLRIPEKRQSESCKTDKKSETRDLSTQHAALVSREQMSSVVPHKDYQLKWSHSESAMSSVSASCAEFLLTADPEDIQARLAVPELRFSMSEIGNCFSEPTPQHQQRSHIIRSSSGVPPAHSLRPITSSIQTRKSLIDSSRLPSQTSFSLEADAIPNPIPPQSPKDKERAYPSLSLKSEDSSDSSCSSSSNDTDDDSFLDVEKNLQAIHDMGIEHLRHKEYPEALEVFEEILRGQLTRYGEEHPRVGTALHNIGIVHMKQGDYQEAAHVSFEAVRIRRLSLPSDHPDIAVSLAQLGVAFLECRKFKKAITQFREALRIRRRCYGPKHPKTAKLLNNIGCALYELNELEVAKVAFEEALETQRSTLREVPMEDLEEPANQILLSIASTLSNIGSIKLYWGLNEEASIDLEEALLIQQSVLGDDHPFAKRTEECLEWMESKANDSIIENDEENSVVASGSDMSRHRSTHLCTSSAISVDQSNEELIYMMDLFHQNLCTFKKSLEVTCHGGDPLIQSTHQISDSGDISL